MGIITACLGLLMVLWGLPAQYRKNRKEKRCGGAFPMVIIPTLLCASRAIYAVQRGAWGIVIPDTVGFTISLFILFQWFKYRE